MSFSARSASWAPLLFQQMTRCHSVFSWRSPPAPVHCRLVASDRLATRPPLLVLRTSGSAPKFPISMTLLRLRLTKTSQTYGGWGTKGEEQYMRRKSFCQSKIRHLGQSYAKDHGILYGSTIVPPPPAHPDKPETLVQPARRRVRLPHLEERDLHRAARQLPEHVPHELMPDSPAAMARRDAEVQDLPFVRGVVRHDVADDHGAGSRHREQHAAGDALPEVVRGPWVGEDLPLDRRDGGNVSRAGGTDPVAGARDDAAWMHQVDRAVPLAAQGIETRGDGHGAELHGRSPGGRHERGDGHEVDPGLLRQPLRRRPADAQSREAPRSVAEHDAREIGGPDPEPGEREID